MSFRVCGKGVPGATEVPSSLVPGHGPEVRARAGWTGPGSCAESLPPPCSVIALCGLVAGLVYAGTRAEADGC